MPANNIEFFGPWVKNDPGPLSTNGLSGSGSDWESKRISPLNSRHGSPVISPPSTSPPRTYSPIKRNFSSNFVQIPEDREIETTHIQAKPKPQDRYARLPRKRAQWKNTVITLMLWPVLLTSLIINFILFPIRVLITPTFWLSAVLWLFWKIAAVPLLFIKRILIFFNTPLSERYRKKRTILISSGSTIQSLHLARNFYSAGARVIVCEFEGHFGLAKFSTAVDKFYTIPKVTPYNVNDYISALCNIVAKEKPTLYVPVSSSNPAYYDALARPHLELMGCKSFVPGAQEIMTLDNPLELFRNCENNEISIPPYRIVGSKDEVFNLYQSGWLSNYPNIMYPIGFNGVIERIKFVLPRDRREFKFPHEISEEKPWIVIRDVAGKHYYTCTTVKDSKVVANVTCSSSPDTESFTPEFSPEIDRWLENFFNKVRFQRLINGHFSFRFARSETTGELLVQGARVGVTLPYICYTSVQSKILCKPCRHFSRSNSGPVVQENGRYLLPEMLISTFRRPSKDSLEKLIGTVIDKREALFVYWDPLPYWAYYHFQVPLKSITHFIRKHQKHNCNLHVRPH